MLIIVPVTARAAADYSPGYPLTREERLKKFHSCARRVLDGSAADRIVELAEQLDSLENVREIMDIVRT